MEEAREVVWPDVEWKMVRDPKGKDDWGYALGVLGSPWALLIPTHLAVTPSITAVSGAECVDPLSQSCRLLSVCVRTDWGQDPERRKMCKEERSRS